MEEVSDKRIYERDSPPPVDSASICSNIDKDPYSLFAFCAVAGTTVTMFLAPVVAALGMFVVVAFSFWPIFVLSLPFLFYGTLVSSLFILCIVFFLWHSRNNLPGLKDRITRWAFFNLPMTGLFLTIFVGCWSFVWGVALGACVFIQGEVLWDRKRPIRYWADFVEFIGKIVTPVFSYFPITCHDGGSYLHSVTSDDSPLLYCYHPHGIYAFGLFSIIYPKISGFQNKIIPPSRRILVGVASSVLHLPLVGSIFAWLGFIPASWNSLRSACETNYDVAIIPGGIAEMVAGGQIEVNTGEWVEKCFLNQRRGFIRLALRTGRSLVPVYAFGETKTFVQYRFWQRAREVLSRRFRVVVQLFRGRYFTLVPFRTPIKVVYGNPIPTRGPNAKVLGIDYERITSGDINYSEDTKNGLRRRKVTQKSTISEGDRDSAETEMVEKLHSIYCDNLRKLFDDNKHLHPLYANAQLEFI